jgi:hypothetical protein
VIVESISIRKLAPQAIDHMQMLSLVGIGLKLKDRQTSQSKQRRPMIANGTYVAARLEYRFGRPCMSEVLPSRRTRRKCHASSRKSARPAAAMPRPQTLHASVAGRFPCPMTSTPARLARASACG